MKQPPLSEHFESRKPSAIRAAQIKFMQRQSLVTAVNVAIGNVCLPMHPKMQERMFNLDGEQSPFKNGVVSYSSTVGTKEANAAVLNIIAASGGSTDGLYSQITDGGSQAMELVILGVCGPAGSEKKPLLMIEPAYANYLTMAERLGRSVVTVKRHLNSQNEFVMPSLNEIEDAILKHKPSGLLLIPYDNPTGQFFNQEMLVEMAKLATKHNLWLISDEAYRELHYSGNAPSSIWRLDNNVVPGIVGRRISIETASKMWNACGLRIGAIVTDHKQFHDKCVAENTANLCANVIGQYIFGALAGEPTQALQNWFQQQRSYYKNITQELERDFKKLLPNLIMSTPESALYTVLDVRNLVQDSFSAEEFVDFCASVGDVDIDGKSYTLLVAPMSGFYSKDSKAGNTQMRIAYVESLETMRLVPFLFKKLLEQFLDKTD